MKVWLSALVAFVLSACATGADALRPGVPADGVVVTVEYTIQPGREDMALQAISAVVAAVRANEPQSRSITVLRGADDKSKITLVEHWPSKDHFLGPHMQQPHIQKFIESSHAFLASPPEIAFWHVQGEP